MSRARRFSGWRLLGLGGWLLLLSGCEIFTSSPDLLSAENQLPAIKPPPDALTLEIVFVERPVNDRLLGETLWRDVDQILNIPPEAQRDVERNGFRVGVVGAHPPPPLQEMLGGLQSGFDKVGSSADDEKLSGNRIFLRSGTTAEVIISPTFAACDMTFCRFENGEPIVETKTFEAANCVFRVTAHRVQEGWARLEFVPEIRHGEERPRPSAGANAWQMLSAQRSERLFNQTFSVMLNVGEMALVTGRSQLPGSTGYRFFLGPEGEDDVQRLLLVRLSHMGQKETTLR